MPRFFIRPYGKSSSAFKLARSLEIKRIVPVETKYLGSLDILEDKYHPTTDDVIFNWGNSKWKNKYGITTMFNQPHLVASTINKIETLEICKEDDIPCIDFTKDSQVALAWSEDGYKVFCRTLIKSKCGKGIVVAKEPSEIVEAPLYTRGEKIKREYRVHVSFNNVIDLTAKAKRNGVQENNVQSWDNGYVFVRNSVKIPNKVRDDLEYLALKTMTIFRLDYGAVDILRNQDNELKVIEINSAPGIEETTLKCYVDSFRGIIG